MPPAQMDAVMERAAGAGLAGVVLVLDDSWASRGEIVARAAEAARARQLRLDALRAPELPWASGLESLRREANRALERLIALAGRLGARRVAMPSAAGIEGARSDDVQARALEALSALRFEAETHGVEIICPCGGGTMLASPIETRDFFDHVNSPWVRAGLELAALRGTTEAVDWIGTLGRRLRWMQAPVTSAAAGWNSLDWGAMAGALRAARCEAMVVCDDIATACDLMGALICD